MSSSYNRRSMSLITCCPSCGTKFRVVADQLRISDGWVRCGRCQEVFDAHQALTEVTSSSIPSASAGAGQEASGASVQPQVQVDSSPQIASTSTAAQSAPSSWPFEAEPASVATETMKPVDIATPATEEVLPSPLLAAPTPPLSAAHAKADRQPEPTPPQDIAPPPTVSGYELPVPPEEPEPDFDALLQAMPSVHDDWLDQPRAPAVDAGHPLPAVERVRIEPVVATAPEEDTDPLAKPATPLEPALQSWEPEKALHAEESQAGMWAEVVRFIHPPKPAELAEPTPVAASDEPVQELLETSWAHDSATQDGETASAEPVPSFVKQAQRRAWWNKPGVRFALGMLLVFLPLALVLQIAVHERNRLAAWKPEWRAGLETMCVLLRCEITPYRNIHAVVLTGSAFAQDAEPYHYKLDLSMQNQAQLSVATPAVELTLTDGQGQVLVRKVLNPNEIGAPAELVARGEWNGTLPVKTQGLNLPVSGYRVTAFYP
ncbi:MAG TPA: DUF3426 domain-containing protein [Comamonas sp.]